MLLRRYDQPDCPKHGPYIYDALSPQRPCCMAVNDGPHCPQCCYEPLLEALYRDITGPCDKEA